MEVQIRPLKIADAYTSYKWRNDPEVFQYTGNTYTQEITLESELNWITHVVNNLNDYRCAILADGEYVGNIYLTNIHDGRAEYHIFIGNKNSWGKGIAKKASELIIKDGFGKLGLNEILLNVRVQNVVAQKLYNRLGFKEISRNSDFINMLLKK